MSVGLTGGLVGYRSASEKQGRRAKQVAKDTKRMAKQNEQMAKDAKRMVDARSPRRVLSSNTFANRLSSRRRSRRSPKARLTGVG